MLNELRDLVFTPKCIGCRCLGVHLCDDCRQQLVGGTRILNTSFGPFQVSYVADYDGWLRRAVLDYKGGAQENRFGLAKLLVGHVANSCLVAMPSTEAKIKSRGFDTVTVLATTLRNEQRNVKFVKNALTFRRNVSDQIGLSAKARTANLAGAFVAQRRVPASLVLLDDVVTTGASMVNAAQALHLAGAKNISGLALCTTPDFGLRYPYGSHPGP